MDNFKELKINSFRKNNSFFKDDEKKKYFLSLNKNSLFLKRVIEIKQRERNLSKKLLGIKSKRFGKNNENCINFETLPVQHLSRIYKNPQYFQTLLKKTKAEYPNRRKANIYSPNIHDISKINTSISNSSNHKMLYLSFHKIYRPNSFLAKYEMNPFFTPNLIYQSNKNNFSKCNTESRVLSFNGRKMFAPLSLSKKNNRINSQNLYENKSELYRNYHELKLKKEEIYKRKLKQNLSAEERQILNIIKEKDIKQQTIENLTINNNLNRANKLMKIKKIPKGNKKLKYIKEENAFKKNEESKNSNSISSVHKIDKKIILKLNNKNVINAHNLTSIKNQKLFINKQNNIKHIKYIRSRKSSNKIIKNNINITEENKENISLNIINRKVIKNESNTLDDISKKNKKIIIPKNNIIRNIIKESIFHSRDNKLVIKIHTLKNRNQIFSKKKASIPMLLIEKFDFCISNKNNSNNNSVHMIIFHKKANNNLNNEVLSSIKE